VNVSAASALTNYCNAKLFALCHIKNRLSKFYLYLYFILDFKTSKYQIMTKVLQKM